MLNDLWTRYRDTVIVVLSFVLALVIGAFIISLFGVNPLDAYIQMFWGALGNKISIFSTLSRMVPILLTSFAICISFSAGMWNIGVEGQLYLGAMATAAVGLLNISLPPIIFISLGLLAGVLAGCFWAYIPGKLYLRKGVNIVVMTIMFNSIAILFTSFLAVGPLAAPHGGAGATEHINTAMRFAKITPFSNLNEGIYVVLYVVVWVIFLMMFAVWGYECKMIRLNQRCALYGGIDVEKRQTEAMIYSGGIAGFCGALLVMGVQYRFLTGISPGYSWIGMILAMMVGYNPIGAIIASFLYAVMSSGAIRMELFTGVPVEVVDIILSIAVLFVSAGMAISNRLAYRLRED